MYADTLILDKADGVDATFRRRRNDATGSEYIDAASTLSNVRTFAIKHQTNGKGTEATDRHLVSFQHTLPDATGKPRIATVNCSIAVPRDTVVTNVVVKDLLVHLMDFLSDQTITTMATMTNVDSLLRGES